VIAFWARAAVCERKADGLAFVADQIRRVDADSTSRFADRLDTTRSALSATPSVGTPRWSGAAPIRAVAPR
jgi:hypothetical protein